MARLWTLLAALLLLLWSAAEPLSSPEENEVLKHTEGELTKKQASDPGEKNHLMHVYCNCAVIILW